MGIIDGKAISLRIREELKEKVSALKKRKISPCLAVIMIGDDPASAIYVRNKIKACEDTGIKSLSYHFDADVEEKQVEKLIDSLNGDDSVHGILVQVPLPRKFNEKALLARIDISKDVDGFSAYNIGQLALGNDGFKSCTPYGVIKLLEYSNVDIAGKNAVVIGRSNTVGKPMALMLLEKNATVTICHSKTRDLKNITSNADILIAAIGKAHFVTADMVKEGAVVIDVGINKLDGKTVGDVCFDEVSKKASLITPVPGGVGPMTITMLLFNTLKSAESR